MRAAVPLLQLQRQLASTCQPDPDSTNSRQQSQLQPQEQQQLQQQNLQPSQQPSSFAGGSMATSLAAALLQQAVERLGRLRETAVGQLQRLLRSGAAAHGIQHQEQLAAVVMPIKLDSLSNLQVGMLHHVMRACMHAVTQARAATGCITH